MHILRCRANLLTPYYSNTPMRNFTSSDGVLEECCYNRHQSPDHQSPISILWRGGRAVDCAGLENRKAERPREFESHPLRFVDYQALISESSLRTAPPHKCGQRPGRIRHEIIAVTAPRSPDTSKRTRHPNSLQFWGEQGTRRVFLFGRVPAFFPVRRFPSASNFSLAIADYRFGEKRKCATKRAHKIPRTAAHTTSDK